MKVIAINGSPRKNRNSATLLQKALEGAKSVGADIEINHLYDLNFKGCTSCFACKRKNSNHIGHCVVKDDLTSVLEKIKKCNVLLLGTPIYFANTTGAMQSFLERLLFPGHNYECQGMTTDLYQSLFPGKVSSGFIYTMNAPEDIHSLNIPEEFMKFYNYDCLFQIHKQLCGKILNGPSEFLLSQDTYQFDDYSQYKASRFDEKHKDQVKREQYPIDCQKAFDMGARLAGAFLK
ncbi:flavodoxin family protein [Pelosinus sp. sgz500959]|uniref:flavodoxin family protein n=1 Tax=Pelosinus sp. sgz500959 TaxID=3242472 RepID=UPI003670915D